MARGRRRPAPATGTGHPAGTVAPRGRVEDIAVSATLRAAALRSSAGSGGGLAPLLPLRRDDIRVKRRRAAAGSLILFVVDASGSMGARKRMIAVKNAVLGLLMDAYQKRDWIGLIAFRNRTAEVLAPPTNSVDLAASRLRRMPTGGRTPLAAGIQRAEQIFAPALRRTPGLAPLLVLVTDGHANEGPPPLQAIAPLQKQGIPILVVDSEEGYVRLGAARQLAMILQAEYTTLAELAKGALAGRS